MALDFRIALLHFSHRVPGSTPYWLTYVKDKIPCVAQLFSNGRMARRMVFQTFIYVGRHVGLVHDQQVPSSLGKALQNDRIFQRMKTLSFTR